MIPMGDDRPSVYYEDNVLIIRASAIGGTCLWELVAAGQGYEQGPVPDFLQAAFDEGHRLEPIINEMLEERGYVITGSQEEGHLDISPTLRIRYHPDGFVKSSLWPDRRILEDKTMADSSWQKAARGSVGDVFAEYNWQISVMMWANATRRDYFGENHHEYEIIPMPALWVAYNKGNTDGSPCPDQGRLLYQTVDRPPITLGAIVEKAFLIQSLVEGEDIMVSGRPCDDLSHFPCRYIHIRPEPEQLIMDISGPGSDNPILTIEDNEEQLEVDTLVRDYLMFKGQADEAKQRMEVAKLALIAKANGAKRILTDKWVIPVINGSNSSPDYASMPQRLKDELAEYKKVTHYKYLKGIKPLD